MNEILTSSVTTAFWHQFDIARERQHKKIQGAAVRYQLLWAASHPQQPKYTARREACSICYS